MSREVVISSQYGSNYKKNESGVMMVLLRVYEFIVEYMIVNDESSVLQTSKSGVCLS